MTDASEPSPEFDASGRRCTAHTSSGRRCRRFAIRGGAVCPTHGGSIRRVKAAAERRHVRQQAEVEFRNTFGDPAGDVDPSTAVLEQLTWSHAHVVWLREKVRDIDPDALVWGVVSETDHQATEFPGVDKAFAAKPNVWLALYAEERDRLVRIAKIAHDMGIEERRVALAERVGSLMADLLRGVLDELDLTDEQQGAARLAVPRHLALIASTLTEGIAS